MPVSHSFNRRLLVAGGLASAGAAILANNQRKDASDARFGGGGILSHSRDPLQIAFLDRHAFRLEPLIPELEIAIGRRIMVEALSFDQLYANFTIDLLQQTGRYDIVSICESWFPYFGRAGYFSDLEPPEGAGNRIFPARFVEAARGIDGTDLLAHPWTFDFVMSAFGPDDTHESWTDYLRWVDARPEHRVLVPLQRGDVAADSFRAMSLTYGQDVVDVVTQLPGLNRYGSARALMTLANLAARAGHDRVFGTTWDTVAQRATNREIDDAPLILASDMAGPLSSGWHGQRLPVGRPGRSQTAGRVWMLAVPAGAPARDDARAAVRWLTGAGQQRLWPDCRLLPATRPAINAMDGPMPGLMMGAIDTLAPVARLRSFQLIMQIVGDAVPTEIESGDRKITLAAADERARQVLSDEGELGQ